MILKKILIVGLGLIGVAALALGAALAFGGPGAAPAMDSINAPFRSVDWSGMPQPARYTARDGTALAYRAYRPEPGTPARGSVVLVHGSSARANSMHAMARGFAQAGIAAYALDMRGHGDSGRKGQIAYLGQLEDDLQDFMAKVRPPQPATLAGFSAGGGFALRFAASERQSLFAGYLLLSPFLGQDAPTYRPDSGGWVRIGVPRIVALSVLDGLGIHAFDALPVVRFALAPQVQDTLTPTYTLALAQNFRPHPDWRADVRAARQPVRVLAGLDDEAFYTDRLEAAFRAEGQDWPVTLLSGIGHIPLTLDGRAIAAARQEVEAMQQVAGRPERAGTSPAAAARQAR